MPNQDYSTTVKLSSQIFGICLTLLIVSIGSFATADENLNNDMKESLKKIKIQQVTIPSFINAGKSQKNSTDNYPDTAAKILGRMIVKQVAEKNLNSGTETSGGGGNLNRGEFYRPLIKALERLSAKDQYVIPGANMALAPTVVQTRVLIAKLSEVVVTPTEEQLYDRLGQPVDFYNGPSIEGSPDVIFYNNEAWRNMSEFKQIHYGLHELLGLGLIPDPAYAVSFKLAEIATSNIPDASDDSALGTKICGYSIDQVVIADARDTAQQAMEGFKSEGAEVKTCRFSQKQNKAIFIVIGIYPDHKIAVLINE